MEVANRLKAGLDSGVNGLKVRSREELRDEDGVAISAVLFVKMVVKVGTNDV